MRLLNETRGKPLRWKSLLASNADADESDSRTVKRALRWLRLLEPPAEAITGVPDTAMFRAIETFQRRQGQRRQGREAPEHGRPAPKRPRRGQRGPEGGLRWGAFAPRRASRRLPDAPHRAACRSYPRGKSAPMK